MTRYQEPGTERTVDVDETSGELLLALGWTLAQPAPADALTASLADSLADTAPFQPVDAFDPGAHTAQEVLAYLGAAEDPAEVARVLIAEVDGKHRTTVLAFNPSIPTDADDLLGEAE